MDFNNLDSGTQFKIFDRVLAQMQNIGEKEVENGAMDWLINLITIETEIAETENAEMFIENSIRQMEEVLGIRRKKSHLKLVKK